MKKSTYPLLAILLLLVVGIAVLFFMNQDKQRQIDTLGEQITTLTTEKTTWQTEKARWEADKAQMGQSLGQVHAALSRTLLDVSGITSSLNSALVTVGEAYQAASLPAGAISTLGADSQATPPATAPSTQPDIDKPQDVPASAPDTATPAIQDEPSITTAPASGDAKDTAISPGQDTITHAAGSDQASKTGSDTPTPTPQDATDKVSTSTSKPTETEKIDNSPTPSDEASDKPSNPPTSSPTK